jgi:hypothetical protein
MKGLEPAKAVGIVLTALIILQLGLAASTILSHQVHVDEAWIGEQAYFLSHHGIVRSDLFGELPGDSDRIVVHHWLFVRVAALASAAAGWGLTTLRFVTLLCAIGLFAALALDRRGDADRREGLVAAAIVALTGVAFEHLRMFRPEMLVALCGVLSFGAIMRTTKLRGSAAAGAFAALAALAHPYGAVFIGAGIILLAIERRWRDAALFAAAAILVLLPYALDLVAHLDEVRAELASPIVGAKREPGPLALVTNLAREHERLFRRLDIGVATLLWIVGLIVHLRMKDRARRALVLYTLLVVAIGGAIMPDKVETRYAIIALPFMAMIAARAIVLCRESVCGRWLTWTVGVVAMALVASGLYADARCLSKHRGHGEIRAAVMAAHAIPSGSTVIAPVHFAFGGLGRHRVVGLFDIAARHSGRLSADAILDAARRERATYLVIVDGEDPIERITDEVLADLLERGATTAAEGEMYAVYRLPSSAQAAIPTGPP